MNNLLKPGYVRFDGTKFVTDDTIELTGPTGLPGPQGIPGTNGTSGTSGSNGLNAFANLTAGFTVPNVAATVVITVDNASWMVVGLTIFIGTAGYFAITHISGTSITVENLGLFQITPGTAISSPQLISPAGMPGPARFRIALVAGIQSAAGTTYFVVGGSSIDTTDIPTTFNTVNIYFIVDYGVAVNTDTASIRLWDSTNGVLITGTTDSTSNVSPVKRFVSSALTLGTSSGNIRTDVIAQYQVQMAVTAGSITNNAICYDAYLLVKYS